MSKQPVATAGEGAEPMLTNMAEEESYGRNYELLMQALEVAVRKGANKWTAKDFKGCFPTISSSSEERSRVFDEIWARTAANMREMVMKQAQQLLEHYNTGPALLQFHHTIQKAREARKEDEEQGQPDKLRPDAWRPDMTPQALMAAHNLPQYDAVYERLRTEYLELTKESQTLYEDVKRKQDLVKQLEEEIGTASQQLEETVQALETHPTDQMHMWMEQVHTTVPDKS
ncbi:hypothetical protein QFC20_003453 [Naganishia adeliensis]|uniref:Uncharacterized protein n=1 Tax=Naganishia adeliensis TaxID=92952 RepID=A0ACC2W976_9TREE|nr:hypothetical protein QFC20_003453 [Naganishia adeliensis]